MKSTAFFTILAVFLAGTNAVPTTRDNGPAPPTDMDVLNFALTLEHLENAFYTGGLKKYSQQDFLNAGLEQWARGRFEEIMQHEQTHVDFLQSALGSKAVKPCTYKFPDTDPKSFVDVSEMLETVGASAYTGAAKFLKNADYLTAAASILATEARHSAWINSAVRHANPWSTSFEAPLDLNQVFTIASGLIVDCPKDNTPIPVKAFPMLTLSATSPGKMTTLTFTTPSDKSEQLYAAFISGLTTTFVPLGGKDCKEVKVPGGLRGAVYVVITSLEDEVSDEETVAGPAMVSFDFDSNGNVEMVSL